MDLSIVIPNYNGAKYISECINAVYSTIKNLQFELIIIDNASTDESLKIINDYARNNANLKIIKNSENKYFAKANNQGYEISSGKYLMFLNSDAIIHDQMAEKLIHFIEKNNDVGIVGPKCLNSDGTFQIGVHRLFPTFANTFFLKTKIGHLVDKIFFANKHFDKFLYREKKYIKAEDVEELGAVCILMKRSTIKMLGVVFDESFPLFYNDVDLCKRLYNLNLRRCVLPDATLTHLGSMSSKLIPKGEFINHDLLGLYTYFKKHFPYSSGLIFILFPKLIVTLLNNVFNKKKYQYKL